MTNTLKTLAFGSLVALGTLAQADVVNVNVTKDATHPWDAPSADAPYYWSSDKFNLLMVSRWEQAGFYAALPTTLDSNVIITKATLNYSVVGLYWGETASYNMNVYRFTEDWTPNANAVPAYDPTPVSSTYFPGGSPNWGNFSLDITDLVKDWVSGKYENYGVILQIPGDGDNHGPGQGIISTVYGDGAIPPGNTKPYFSIEYTTAPVPEPAALTTLAIGAAMMGLARRSSNTKR